MNASKFNEILSVCESLQQKRALPPKLIKFYEKNCRWVGQDGASTDSGHSKFNFLSDEFIHQINSNQTSWKAGRNFHPDNIHYVKRLMGTFPENNRRLYPTVRASKKSKRQIPKSFDARERWPHCPSINEIREQGSCAACWAVAAAATMTDRYCIHSKGRQHFHFSATDLLSCDASNAGCGGGLPSFAWRYWQEYGIVSGGEYNSNHGCRPYEIPACEHYISGPRPNCTVNAATPKCLKKCRNGYEDSYENDKRYGAKVYSVPSNQVEIMAEIYENGPVQAVFFVYEDFTNYKSGVYQHNAGKSLFYHSVKLIGWGVEGNNKYWLAANTWSNDWGNNGFFKILRGQNHCMIESTVYAGIPIIKGESFKPNLKFDFS